jgi:hypothetical protein
MAHRPGTIAGLTHLLVTHLGMVGNNFLLRYYESTNLTEFSLGRSMSRARPLGELPCLQIGPFVLLPATSFAISRHQRGC